MYEAETQPVSKTVKSSTQKGSRPVLSYGYKTPEIFRITKKKKNQYIAVVITQHNQIVLIPKINTKFDIRIYM